MMRWIVLCGAFIEYSHSLKQLSFSGGGAWGAIEIGILKRVMESENTPFDLYTGISSGALNAGVLSYYSDLYEGMDHIEQLYGSIQNQKVFSSSHTNFIIKYKTSS